MQSRTLLLVSSCLVAFGIAAVLACGSEAAPDDQVISSAARGGIPGKPPDQGPPDIPDEASNNLSFPVIGSDNALPAFAPDGPWTFDATIVSTAECVQESSTATVIDPSFVCYYGGKTTTQEDGSLLFDSVKKVWWLQKRDVNFWKAFTLGYTGTEFSVSAVDVGDLLESSPTIATRQIRTEFNLLQDASADPLLAPYVVSSWPTCGCTATPACNIPDVANESVGCFAAVAMSGAVPLTQQSGNEMQGTDFGPGPAPGLLTGTRAFVDPTTVRFATATDGTVIPVHALVYSKCARLVIQKIAGTPTWNTTAGQWTGEGVGSPVVNDGLTAPEITSSGAIVYGYNWNASTVPTGTYRLTFVIDGPSKCSGSKTKFAFGTTQLVNVGEARSPVLISAGDSALGDEGGLVYLDLELSTKGGGGGGGPGGPGGP